METTFLFEELPVIRVDERFVIFHLDSQRFMETAEDPRSDKEISQALRDEGFLPVKRPEAPAKRKYSGITFLMTEDCNQRCGYCYLKGGETRETLSFTKAQIVLDHIINQLPGKRLNLTFHAGEPTIKFDLMRDIIEYTKRKDVKVSGSIISNGTACLDKYLYLLENGFHITISLDGPKEIYDKQRPGICGVSLHEIVERNVRELARRADISVHPTVTKLGVESEINLAKYFCSLGVSHIYFGNLHGGFRRDGGGQLQTAEPQEFVQMMKSALAHKGTARIGISGFATLSPQMYGCGAITGNSVIVTPTGDLTACYETVRPQDDFYETMKIGKVDEEKRTLVWFQDKIDKLRLRTVDNLADCMDCVAKYTCAGGCTVEALREKGDIMAVSNCDTTRELTYLFLSGIYRKSKEQSRQLKVV